MKETVIELELVPEKFERGTTISNSNHTCICDTHAPATFKKHLE